MSWSPALLVERLGGDEELAREMVTLFVDESPAMLAAVRQGVAGGDAGEIRHAAHALKGSVANFVSDGAATTAFDLEQAARNGRLDHAPALLAQLEEEVAALVAEMRDYERGTLCAS